MFVGFVYYSKKTYRLQSRLAGDNDMPYIDFAWLGVCVYIHNKRIKQ